MCSQFGYIGPDSHSQFQSQSHTQASNGDALTILLTIGLLMIAVIGPICIKTIEDGEMFEGY